MASFLAPPPAEPPSPQLEFFHDAHVKYITQLAKKLSKKTSYEGVITAHLRMSGVYWSITALSLIVEHSVLREAMGMDKIVEWVFQCYDAESGGFGGNVGHDPHILYTLSALQILAIDDKLEDERLDKEKVVGFITALMREDGSFKGDKWGEVDTRFSYCALSSLSLLASLSSIDVNKAAEYVALCKNFDGGFGAMPGAESHAGQIFCCVAALSIAKRLDLLDVPQLSWWLSERQCDSGGLNGRPEKQADVCYSWWILSSLSIMGKTNYINTDKLGEFILKCQDEADGGISDRPQNVADVFHTFFGISGLLLLGYFDKKGGEKDRKYKQIDPVYALPRDVVERMGLQGQVVKQPNGDKDYRYSGFEKV